MFLFLILKYCCLNLDSSIGKVSIFTDGRYLYMMLLFYYLYLWNIGRNSKICENSCEYQYRHVYGFPEFAKYIFGFVLLFAAWNDSVFVVSVLKWCFQFLLKEAINQIQQKKIFIVAHLIPSLLDIWDQIRALWVLLYWTFLISNPHP